MEYNKRNIFYLALTENECFRLPLLNFLSNGFRLRLHYKPVFRENEPALKRKSSQTGIQA